MSRPISLRSLPTELNDSVYTDGKYPLLIDPTGQAVQYLKYRARYLSIYKKGDFDKETLRKALVQALHNGATLVIDFDNLECDLDSLFVNDFFPATVLNPLELFLEETYGALLRPEDEYSAKVTYEHQDALAQGAFQDRTKCHAPERVADIDTRFSPKDAFRLVVATKAEEPPAALAERMGCLKVQVSDSQVKENAGIWGGGERPKEEKSKEQLKLDSDLLEFAFDGELAEVKSLLEKDADPRAKDGRGNNALSEAACNGHLEVVACLLDYKAPLGSDPNAAGNDGRTAVHRAAFQGHHLIVQVLLERGGDPRIKDKSAGEKPFDMASNEETRKVLESWDITQTDKLKEERVAAQDIADQSLAKTDAERTQLEKRKKMAKIVELIQEGASGLKDALEMELMDITSDGGQIGTYRDDRGNSVLHLAAEFGRLDCVEMLIDEMTLDVNLRDGKGWTPVAIAGFRGHKKVVQALISRKADPLIENAYRKDAFAVAKDDEIRDAMKECDNQGAASSDAPAGSTEEASPDGDAKGKAKAKAKAKADAAEPKSKAAAKPKAKGKAKGK